MQVAELDHPKRWSSWLSAAHSLRCFERKKKPVGKKTGAQVAQSLTFFV